jgi:hypothetical protein
MAGQLTCRWLVACLAIGTLPAPGHAQAPAAAPVPRAAEPATANYESSRINAKPLPFVDRALDEHGVQYRVEFVEMILSIRPKHEFRASLRYRQTLAAKGEAIGSDPIQKMTVYGSWATAGNAIRFVPDPKRGGEGLRILDGTFKGGTIEVPFDYQNGSVSRRAAVILIRNDNIF